MMGWDGARRRRNGRRFGEEVMLASQGGEGGKGVPSTAQIPSHSV